MTAKSNVKLSWDSYPIKDESKLKSIILCLLVISFSSFCFYYLGKLYALITLIVLSFSLHKYFLRTSYLLDLEGIQVKTPLRTYIHPWDYFKRYYISAHHIGLTSEEIPSRLDNFRSITIKLPHDQLADEVKSFVRENMEGKCLN